jgi:hypothetical protein
MCHVALTSGYRRRMLYVEDRKYPHLLVPRSSGLVAESQLPHVLKFTVFWDVLPCSQVVLFPFVTEISDE